MSEPDEFKEEIYNFLKRGAVSFAEIQNKYGSGEIAYGYKDCTFYWFSLTEPTADAIHELYCEKRILFYPTTYLVYLADGMIPKAPIAKSSKDYKTDHWLPVVIWRTDMVKNILKPRERKMFRTAGWDV